MDKLSIEMWRWSRSVTRGALYDERLLAGSMSNAATSFGPLQFGQWPVARCTTPLGQAASYW
jgi:hypothetical protein